MSDRNKTILLAFVGNAPAVLTEIVWELTRSGEYVDEICIFGAHASLNRVQERIFAGAKQSLWAQLQTSLRRRRLLPSGCSLPMPQFIPFIDRSGQEVGAEVYPEDLDAVSNQLLHFIRERKARETPARMIISISGERKCTSAQLQTAAALAADERDRLIHVLISDEFAFNRRFFYPGQKERYLVSEGSNGESRTLDATQAQVTIIDIPFIPIGGLMALPGALDGSFQSIVERARSRMGKSHVVVFRSKEEELYIDDVEISRPCALSKNKMEKRAYFYLALHALKQKLGASSLLHVPVDRQVFFQNGFGFLWTSQYRDFRRILAEWRSLVGKDCTAPKIPQEIAKWKHEAKKRLEIFLGADKVESIFIFSAKLTPRYADSVHIDVLP